MPTVEKLLYIHDDKDKIYIRCLFRLYSIYPDKERGFEAMIIHNKTLPLKWNSQI